MGRKILRTTQLKVQTWIKIKNVEQTFLTLIGVYVQKSQTKIIRK